MTTNPSQGKRSDAANSYGGYSGGYKPSKPSEDPYGAYSPPQSDPDYEYGQSQQGMGGGQGQQQQQQQQYTYQAPESVTRKRTRRSAGAATFASGRVSTDAEDRKFALFSYLGFCFTGIVFFVLKRKSPYVRFHAAQSVVLFAPAFAALLIIKILSFLTIIPLLGILFSFVFTILNMVIVVPMIVLWLFLMFTAWRGTTVKLPYVGDIAERFVSRGRP